MENENNEEVIIDSQENNEEIEIDLGEEVIEETPEVIDEQQEQRQEETLEARRARLKRQLEQTEKKLGLKIEKPIERTTSKKEEDISPRDVLAFMSAGISDDDDIEQVKKVAKLEGISISQALKLDLTKTLLAKKKEERTVALATNTGGARRGTSKVSDDVLLSRASQGLLPESEEDIQRLYKLRRR